MKMISRCSLLSLCLLLAVAAHGQSSPYDDTDAACKKILAAAPQPPANQGGAYQPNCDSTKYYFGIGHGIDYAAARQCAYAERSKPDTTDSSPFAGAGVLSMIYANGQGVPRNIPLARRLVCEAGGAPAEISGRLDLLDKIAAATAKPAHFDVCETATSGLSGGWCQSIDSRKSDVPRSKEIAAFKAALPAKAVAAFALLQKVEAHFEDLSSSNEIDLSGTLRAAFEQQHQDALRDQFLANLQSLEKPTPAATPNADAALNAVYARLRTKLPADQTAANTNPGDFGTINFAGERDTERIWLDLRNVWVNFIKLAKPQYPTATFTSVLTKQRAQQLQDILSPPIQ
jgi:uncharacterized protein YecT (DUF1311 family)